MAIAPQHDVDAYPYVVGGPDDPAAEIQALWEGLAERAATHTEIEVADQLAHLEQAPVSEVLAFIRANYGKPGYRALVHFLKALRPRQAGWDETEDKDPLRASEAEFTIAENLRQAEFTRGDRGKQLRNLIRTVGVRAVSPWAALLWRLPAADFDRAAQALCAGQRLKMTGGHLVPDESEQSTETVPATDPDLTEETDHDDADDFSARF